MIRQSFPILLTMFCLGSSVNAFSSGTAQYSSVAFARKSLVSSTCLYAEETAAQGGDSEKVEEEIPATPSDAGTDILSSPAFLKRKLEVLKSDIAKVEEDLAGVNKLVEEGKAEWGHQIDDLQREYKMIQERMAKQSKEGNGAATVQVARKMLDVLDVYDRAFGAVSAESESEKEVEAAYRKTYDMILSIFKDLGITEVETVGKEFDYEVHQAVMQRPSEYEEGIVCEELQKGFVIGDRLIRAAMVSVAA